MDCVHEKCFMQKIKSHFGVAFVVFFLIPFSQSISYADTADAKIIVETVVQNDQHLQQDGIILKEDDKTDSKIQTITDSFISETNFTLAKPENTNTYSQDDLEILAHVLCGECQSYPDEEQLYVGSVVLNRVNSSKYPDSIREVVFQDHQYSCVTDGNYYRTPTERNWANAKWLLENGSVLPENVVYQAKGKQGRGLFLQTKYHCYCY